MPNLEIYEVVLVHFDIINNIYQQNSSVLYTFIPNKSFGHSIIRYFTQEFWFLKTFKSEIS